MSTEYDPPTEPADIPSSLLEELNALNPDELRQVTRYTDALAEHKEREQRSQEIDTDNDETPEVVEETPDGVPSRATLTVKEINDNRYYYWQWREGDKIKSKYKAPVNPSE